MRTFVLEERIGPVPCRVEPTGADSGRAQFDLPRLPQQVGAAGDNAAIAAALNIRIDDIGFEGFAPALLVGRKSLRHGAGQRAWTRSGAAAPSKRTWSDAFGTDAAQGRVHVLPPDRGAGTRLPCPHVRAALWASPEDPATGSAAAAFAGLLAREALADGEHAVRIEQGYEMGRPSLIELRSRSAAASAAAAAISGGAVVVMRRRRSRLDAGVAACDDVRDG